MRRLIFKSFQSPGDIVMLTAAVRDLHAAAPGQFQTDVRTSAKELWLNNPHITPLADRDSGVETVKMNYPLIHRSNQRPYHFLHGYSHYLEERLGIRIPITRFHGDIHLSPTEKRAPLPADWQLPDRYWIVIAGGKYDFTAKWWPPAYFQEVVDHFCGKIHFVQCGEAGHWHPELEGVVNLIGKTTLRDFVRLMYHADGVLCPVTFAMHLAAAVERKPGKPKHRPCVVVAGGREPPHWEAYPHHQYLSTVGALSCCADGGCWKSRCQLVGDGDAKDRHNVCEQPIDVTSDLRVPACMAMITPIDVIRRVELYYEGGILPNCRKLHVDASSVANTSLFVDRSKSRPAAHISAITPRPKIYLPYRGEFGHKIMWHVPWINSQPGPKVVCCEPGEETLFPSAMRHILVERKRDIDRREWLKYDERFLTELRHQFSNSDQLINPLDRLPQSQLSSLKRFIPQPVQQHGIQCDIVVCPRKRDYGAEKNWPYWPDLVKLLSGRYTVFAAGAPDSSCDVPCGQAWQYERYLDASIEAILSSRVVVATDAGLAHLAMLCGRPLVVISHGKSHTAPGNGPIKLQRYRETNHRQVPIKVIQHGWKRLDYVLRWAIELAGDAGDNYYYWTHRYATLGDDRTVCNCRGDDVNARTRTIAREFQRLLPKQTGRLLDFGCGPGRLAPVLQKHCQQYYGTDLVPEVVERARAHAGTFAPLIDGQIPFDGVSFDTIITVKVLQHMVNEELFLRTLDQFHARMKSGGTLLLHENIAHRRNSGHMQFRTAEEYCRRLNAAGFIVEQISAAGKDFLPEQSVQVDEMAKNPRDETHAYFKAARV